MKSLQSTSEIVSHLVACGCQDLTSRINMATFNDFPVSNGGFSDIYRGRLTDGTQVAVKALRISTSQDSKHLKVSRVGCSSIKDIFLTKMALGRSSRASYMEQVQAPKCAHTTRVGGVSGSNRDGVSLDERWESTPLSGKCT
jgi:hypothetical protein